jgi:hypothetical protein
MKEEIYRKESLETISSPDQLNEYIRVVKPSVWITLAAIIVFLTGVILWGIFGVITTTVKTGCTVSDGMAIIFISQDDISKVKAGLKVDIQGTEATVRDVFEGTVEMQEGDGLQYYSGINPGTECYMAHAEVPGLEDGTYPADIQIENLNPISFVIH